MHKYAYNMSKYASNMHKLCRYMHTICTKYAITWTSTQQIRRSDAKNMQKYALHTLNVQIHAKICIKYAIQRLDYCKYAKNMQKICTNIQKNMQKICKKYAEYAKVYVLAYFAYICTPHFADALPASLSPCRGLLPSIPVPPMTQHELEGLKEGASGRGSLSKGGRCIVTVAARWPTRTAAGPGGLVTACRSSLNLKSLAREGRLGTQPELLAA